MLSGRPGAAGGAAAQDFSGETLNIPTLAAHNMPADKQKDFKNLRREDLRFIEQLLYISFVFWFL